MFVVVWVDIYDYLCVCITYVYIYIYIYTPLVYKLCKRGPVGPQEAVLELVLDGLDPRVRSVFKTSCLFLRPRLWQLEI